MVKRMSEQVIRRPSGKPRIKPMYLYGGAGVVVIAAVLLAKRRTAAQDTAASTDVPDTTGSDILDYGSEDYYSGASAYGTTPTLGSYVDPSTGAIITGGTVNTITAPTTNPQWFQQTVAYLSQQGYDTITVSAALGAYLAGAGLTPNQLHVVQAAIAAEGYPPSRPTAPHLLPAPGQTNPSPKQLPAPILHVSSKGKSSWLLSWSAVPHATHYHLHRNGVFVHNIDTGTSIRVTHSGNFDVIALAPNWISSRHSNIVAVKI
jgi:hypothetical protein